jgi:hypothetical protein
MAHGVPVRLGGKLETPLPQDEDTPLHLAAVNGKKKATDALIAADFDFYTTNKVICR